MCRPGGDSGDGVGDGVVNKEKREKLRELALEATPGEWKVASDLPAYAIYTDSGRRVVQTPNQNNRKQWGPSYDTHGIDRHSDAAYIAAANPVAVLALLDRIDELEAAAEVESAEPDYWVSVDGVYVDFGMRRPMAEDDGANWCARTEVNQHINDSMGDQPGLRLHLEPLYRHPPSAVPEGWQPIETAPKDETPVLLRSKYGSHGDGYWLQSAKGGVGAWVWPYIHNEPWFWMPLPAAPYGGGENE